MRLTTALDEVATTEGGPDPEPHPDSEPHPDASNPDSESDPGPSESASEQPDPYASRHEDWPAAILDPDYSMPSVR